MQGRYKCMLRTLSFGSLDKTTFTVADTIPSQGAIHWSYYKGLLVQSKPVSCPEWPGKKNPLLLTGLPVEVDGFSFNCRIPILPDDLDICQAVDWGEWRFWAVKWTNQKAPYIVDLNRRWKGAPSREDNPDAWLRLIIECAVKPLALVIGI